MQLLNVLQVVVIMAGLLPDVTTSVAVMGVSFDITTITYMLPSGVSGIFSLHLSHLFCWHALSATLSVPCGGQAG